MAERNETNADVRTEGELMQLQRYQCQPERTDLEWVEDVLSRAAVRGQGHVYLTLVPEWMRRENQVKQVVELVQAIDQADLDAYWTRMRNETSGGSETSNPALVEGARKHALELVRNTYQSIPLQDMQRMLDLSETETKDLLERERREDPQNDWNVDENNHVRVPINPYNHPKPKKGRDTIEWKQVQPLLA